MLRIVSSVVAVAAIMAIPFTQAEAGKNGGVSRGSSSGARSSFSGLKSSSFSGLKSGGPVHSNKVIIVGNRRNHHRGRFFVGVGAYGLYDTCWRWVPSVYGPRRVWVCDPYSYY